MKRKTYTHATFRHANKWCNFLKCLPDAEDMVWEKVLLCRDMLNCWRAAFGKPLFGPAF